MRTTCVPVSTRDNGAVRYYLTPFNLNCKTGIFFLSVERISCRGGVKEEGLLRRHTYTHAHTHTHVPQLRRVATYNPSRPAFPSSSYTWTKKTEKSHLQYTFFLVNRVKRRLHISINGCHDARARSLTFRAAEHPFSLSPLLHRTIPERSHCYF